MKKLLKEVAEAFSAAFGEKPEEVTRLQVARVAMTMFVAGFLCFPVLSVLLYMVATTWVASAPKLTLAEWLAVGLVASVGVYLCEVLIVRKMIGSGGGSITHGSGG